MQEWKHNNVNEFYNFKTLTLVPVDLSPVEWDLLDAQEREWIRKYNLHVYETLVPHLTEEQAQWMREKYLG